MLDLQNQKQTAILTEDYESCIIYRDKQKILASNILTNLKIPDISNNQNFLKDKLNELLSSNYFTQKFVRGFGEGLLKDLESKLSQVHFLDIDIISADDNTWKAALKKIELDSIINCYKRFWLGLRLSFDIKGEGINHFIAERQQMISYIIREIKKVGDISRSFSRERAEVRQRV